MGPNRPSCSGKGCGIPKKHVMTGHWQEGEILERADKPGDSERLCIEALAENSGQRAAAKSGTPAIEQ